eukprot:Sspe_Gene.85840::Locus_56592_Transcript_1_1_Confidence_1.000_Length_1440::g.85840::m.85840
MLSHRIAHGTAMKYVAGAHRAAKSNPQRGVSFGAACGGEGGAHRPSSQHVKGGVPPRQLRSGEQEVHATDLPRPVTRGILVAGGSAVRLEGGHRVRYPMCTAVRGRTACRSHEHCKWISDKEEREEECTPKECNEFHSRLSCGAMVNCLPHSWMCLSREELKKRRQRANQEEERLLWGTGRPAFQQHTLPC